jgi:hypothetical protein
MSDTLRVLPATLRVPASRRLIAAALVLATVAAACSYSSRVVSPPAAE